MKYKGRRQSENVVDIRDPVGKAKWEVQQIDKYSGGLYETINDLEAGRIQDSVKEAIYQAKEKARKEKEANLDQFRDVFRTQEFERQAMEMLFGPRWND